ncbi:hypothetical protein CHARACLAT_016914 [Characodon lateralis]|uniref:Uncharacterized protein n=1 Tax=Characodon lateralis TaxID=208331 RepID=A0ABU7EMZ0_9TELE|nr:hypothetical protein [Characodon lateralis]
MWGLFLPCHTLAAGVLVVLGVWGWVLWCVPAHSRWLLPGAWAPWLCWASVWGVMCPGSLGPTLDLLGRRRLPAGPVGSLLQLPGASALWLLCGYPGAPLLFSGGGRCSPGGGPSRVPVLWGAFGCLWFRSSPCLSWVQGGRSVALHTRCCIFLMEKPYIDKHAHTYTHRCLDSGVNRYTDVI